ncbi:MAG: hypothetical protein SO014_01055 [Candidatus Limivicinus sp.]|nr:hypothetical protein [Clostridiales bacterium]MDY3859216.1 hypothetical protein [Candidatus Limivicinus sp.]
MKKLINKYEAIKAVISCTGLDTDDTWVLLIRDDGEYIETVLRTGWMKYDCYVDRSSGEVVGIDSEPCVDADNSGYATCASLMKELRYRAAA